MIKKAIKKKVANMLGKYNLSIVEDKYLYPWQINFKEMDGNLRPKKELTDEDRKYLRKENNRYIELKAMYMQCEPSVTNACVWTEDYVSSEDLKYFRGHNAYVWQMKGKNFSPLAYALTTYYMKSIDDKNLLDVLHEDESFGVFTMGVAKKVVSRDLLDSISEIYFLERNLGISKIQELSVLDIGAGYGRFAHRMTCAFKNIKLYLCSDAICTSTFLCEYYIRYRQMGDRVKAIPLTEISHQLSCTNIDLAINIHSFSECTTSAIEWWISLRNMSTIKFQNNQE